MMLMAGDDGVLLNLSAKDLRVLCANSQSHLIFVLAYAERSRHLTRDLSWADWQ